MPKQILISLMAVVLLQAAGSGSSPSAVQRGRYLVEEVAKCGMCHTPHDRDGRMDRQHWLQGAVLWLRPVHPVANWAFKAPPLAGAPGFSDAQLFQVLETGRAHDSSPLKPPMHTYHMTHEDAAAIVAYLKSLPPPR